MKRKRNALPTSLTLSLLAPMEAYYYCTECDDPKAYTSKGLRAHSRFCRGLGRNVSKRPRGDAVDALADGGAGVEGDAANVAAAAAGAAYGGAAAAWEHGVGDDGDFEAAGGGHGGGGSHSSADGDNAAVDEDFHSMADEDIDEGAFDVDPWEDFGAFHDDDAEPLSDDGVFVDAREDDEARAEFVGAPALAASAAGAAAIDADARNGAQPGELPAGCVGDGDGDRVARSVRQPRYTAEAIVRGGAP